MQGDDPELEAIRQRRMQQMMAQQGGGQVPCLTAVVPWLAAERVFTNILPCAGGLWRSDDRGAATTAGAALCVQLALKTVVVLAYRFDSVITSELFSGLTGREATSCRGTASDYAELNLATTSAGKM